MTLEDRVFELENARWFDGPTIHHALCAALDAVIEANGSHDPRLHILR